MSILRKHPAYVLPVGDCQLCSIREHAMCRATPEQGLQQLESFRSKQIGLTSKQHLYQQGQRHKQVYTLYSGWMMQYKTLPSGKRQILRYALPGDFLFFQSDLAAPMQHSAMALTDCSLCVFPRDHLLEMMAQIPQVSIQLATFTARDYEYQIDISHKNAQERLAYLLYDLFTRIKSYDPATTDTVQLPMTQEDLGDTLGLTQVHVNRTLRQLRQEKVLEFLHHRLIIHNFEALKTLAGYATQPLPHSYKVSAFSL